VNIAVGRSSFAGVTPNDSVPAPSAEPAPAANPAASQSGAEPASPEAKKSAYVAPARAKGHPLRLQRGLQDCRPRHEAPGRIRLSDIETGNVLFEISG
jgi:hypothetical protein